MGLKKGPGTPCGFGKASELIWNSVKWDQSCSAVPPGLLKSYEGKGAGKQCHCLLTTPDRCSPRPSPFLLVPTALSCILVLLNTVSLHSPSLVSSTGGASRGSPLQAYHQMGPWRLYPTMLVSALSPEWNVEGLLKT